MKLLRSCSSSSFSMMTGSGKKERSRTGLRRAATSFSSSTPAPEGLPPGTAHPPRRPPTAAAPASGYTLDWWTVDAGGGASAGGSYQLSGGIAQPDAGAMSGGDYQLQGGIWQGTTYFIHLPLVVR